MAVILGIDPGVTGALAWVSPNSLQVMDHSAWCSAHDPAKELWLMLRNLWTFDIAVVESQHARATRDANGKVVQGIASTWNYAEHYGILLGVLASFGKPVHRCDPAVWKANMHVTSDKSTSLDLARKLWPIHAGEMFKLKKYHGRAEAALLAEYGKRFLPLPVRRVL